jgi:hypothetical protein
MRKMSKSAGGRLKKAVGWVLVVYGVIGSLDRLGYFPTAWFSNPISKIVDFFSINAVLYFLYLVFPLMMLILGMIILGLEYVHSKEEWTHFAFTNNILKQAD